MANEKNDLKILELRKQVEDKKKELELKRTRFNPTTNCVLDLEGNKFNLNVLNEEPLTLLMLRLNLYSMSAKSLNIKTPTVSGYTIDSWIADIKNKIATIETRKEETNLKLIEAKLEKLLSDEKKTELEIDEIASFLK